LLLVYASVAIIRKVMPFFYLHYVGCAKYPFTRSPSNTWWWLFGFIWGLSSCTSIVLCSSSLLLCLIWLSKKHFS